MVKHLLLFCSALIFSCVLTPLVRHMARSIGALDRPGGRKIHTVSVPRLGGVSIVLAMLLTARVAFGFERVVNNSAHFDVSAWAPVLLGGAIVFFAGVWDDLRPMPVWVKFLCQAMAACVAIWFGVRIEQVSLLGSDSVNFGVFAIPLTC